MPSSLGYWRSFSQKGGCTQERHWLLSKTKVVKSTSHQSHHQKDLKATVVNAVNLDSKQDLLKCLPRSKSNTAAGLLSLSEERRPYSSRAFQRLHSGPLNDYDLYRRSVCGDLSYNALLVDAAGTLIVPAQPAAKVYHDLGQKYGLELSEAEILGKYRLAYAQPWSQSRLRFENDARPFWRHIVEQATGIKDPAFSEELYQYYITAEAWRIPDPDAGAVFEGLRSAGVKLAVVSNFDTRLRPLMMALNCYDWFDALAVSAEVGAEKPNPSIFWAACEMLNVKPEQAIHVGDDRRNDIWGARDAGCDALLWGQDVTSFSQVAEKIGVHIR